MNYAILITSHKNFDQLVRLVKQLSCDYCDIYIHFNKNVHLNDSEIEELRLLNSKRVLELQTFFGQRIKQHLIN